MDLVVPSGEPRPLRRWDAPCHRRRLRRAAALVLLSAAALGCDTEPDPDLNDDGVVDILDVSLAASCLGEVIPPPFVAIDDPPDGSVVTVTPIVVSGSVDASAGEPCRVADVDADGVVDPSDFAFVNDAFGQTGFPVGGDPSPTVSVNGIEADVVGSRFSAEVPLVPGENVVVAEARDASGHVGVDPITVTLAVPNLLPVADAGPDQTPRVFDVVTLDGSASSDPDGDPLSFDWLLITVPPGSAAALSDRGAVMPSFEVDRPGTYVAELIVNDGQDDSAPDTVSIATLNSPPVADAGSDQTPLVGETVTLDGSASSDVDGDRLTFRWILVTQPAGSGAALSDPTAVQPTFLVDLPGSYVAELVVDDGRASSDPDTVALDTTSARPVADAGPDQTVDVGATVALDGSASSDVDGDLLDFTWSLVVVQPGSTASLGDPGAVFPTFEADLPGTYVAQLVVSDGFEDSEPDTVTIDTVNSAPVADAGPDQTVQRTDLVALDASGSSDADLDLLTQSWSFTSVPPNSAALLSNREAQMPTFVVDELGTYVVQLIVDDGQTSSAPDSVVISTENSAPVADAGVGQSVFVTETVVLDGSGSVDVDGDALDFSWSFSAAPAGSTADFDDPFAVMPSFTVDRPGTYVAQLIVGDGIVDSQPDSVVIVTDNSPPEADAGLDQVVPFGATVTLDGSASSDVDGDPLSFDWVLLETPPGSAASLSDPNAPMPRFEADVDGVFVAQLVVSDGELTSAPDSVDIRVDPLPGIDLVDAIVGAGLQLERSLDLGVSNHGGVTVRIESDDPALARVAPDAFTPGAAVLDVVVPDGSAGVDFVVQGLAGATGSATLTTSAAGFAPGGAAVEVVTPGVALTALNGDLPLGVDDPFQVLIGLPDAGGIALSSIQSASAGNVPALALTVTSSDPGVGQLFTTGPPAPSVAIDFPAGESQTDLTFRSLGGGTTTVSAAIPGFQATANAAQDVSVELPLITSSSATIGAGLQVPAAAALGVADHGGVTVRIESSLPAVALVAPDVTTAGGAFLDVFVPDGDTRLDFVLQGVADRVGVATITLSAPGFADGVGTATIVQPGLAMFALSSSASVGTDDGFGVLTGVPNGAGTGLSSLQTMSAANVPPLELTVASSDGAVGQLVAGSTTAPSQILVPAAGTQQTNLVFRPLAAGVTTVTVSIPQFLTTNGGEVEIEVDPPGLSAFSRTIGAGLQFGSGANLDIADHGGVLVRIESDDPSLARIAPDATTPGADFIEVFVADGSDTAPYVVQGVEGGTGTVTVTVSAPGFTTGTGTITVVQPTVVIAALAADQGVGAQDGFVALIGLANSAQTGLSSLQGVSAGNAAPLLLTLASSDAAVGEVSAGGSSGAAVAVALAANDFQVDASFAALAPGTTTVAATVPGFLAIATGSQTVTVTGP